jgi:hypothetical protein
LDDACFDDARQPFAHGGATKAGRDAVFVSAIATGALQRLAGRGPV